METKFKGPIKHPPIAKYPYVSGRSFRFYAKDFYVLEERWVEPEKKDSIGFRFNCISVKED